MINFRFSLTLISLLILLTACRSEFEKANIDFKKWKADSKGCKGQRLEMVDKLLKNKEIFIGANVGEIFKYLGQPDLQDLMRRDRKKFSYYIEPAESCTLTNNTNGPKRNFYVIITALGTVSEANIAFR